MECRGISARRYSSTVACSCRRETTLKEQGLQLSLTAVGAFIYLFSRAASNVETEMKRDRMEAVCLFVSLLALLSNRMAAGINELRSSGLGIGGTLTSGTCQYSFSKAIC